jgi:hypothetical protein
VGLTEAQARQAGIAVHTGSPRCRAQPRVDPQDRQRRRDQAGRGQASRATLWGHRHRPRRRPGPRRSDRGGARTGPGRAAPPDDLRLPHVPSRHRGRPARPRRA